MGAEYAKEDQSKAEQDLLDKEGRKNTGDSLPARTLLTGPCEEQVGGADNRDLPPAAAPPQHSRSRSKHASSEDLMKLLDSPGRSRKPPIRTKPSSDTAGRSSDAAAPPPKPRPKMLSEPHLSPHGNTLPAAHPHSTSAEKSNPGRPGEPGRPSPTKKVTHSPKNSPQNSPKTSPKSIRRHKVPPAAALENGSSTSQQNGSSVSSQVNGHTPSKQNGYAASNGRTPSSSQQIDTAPSTLNGYTTFSSPQNGHSPYSHSSPSSPPLSRVQARGSQVSRKQEEAEQQEVKLLGKLGTRARLNDYYSLLGVEPDCSPDDLAKARRERSRELHPDHCANDEQQRHR